MTTKREIWDWLLEHGPADVREMPGEDFVVRDALKEMEHSGHVTFRPYEGWFANEADSLNPLPSPLGAGLGLVQGEPPEDEPPNND